MWVICSGTGAITSLKGDFSAFRIRNVHIIISCLLEETNPTISKDAQLVAKGCFGLFKHFGCGWREYIHASTKRTTFKKFPSFNRTLSHQFGLSGGQSMSCNFTSNIEGGESNYGSNWCDQWHVILLTRSPYSNSEAKGVFWVSGLILFFSRHFLTTVCKKTVYTVNLHRQDRELRKSRTETSQQGHVMILLSWSTLQKQNKTLLQGLSSKIP